VGTTINGNAGTGIEMDSGAGALTINTPLVLQNNQQWINNSSNSLTVSSAVSGAGRLTKLGTGTVVLSGTNSYSGGTVVTAGKLIINSAASLPAGSSLTIGASVAQGAVFGSPDTANDQDNQTAAIAASNAVFAEYGQQ
jgi:autotransporter-associated beta strand protein